MLSPLLEGQLMFNADQFALGAALELPSLTAAELDRHKAFDEEKQKEAETFALGDYLTTLAGPPPTGADAATFYGRIARLTGIPEDIVTRNRGFLGSSFVKHSDGGGEVMSAYDASFAAPDPYPESDYDRGDDAILDGFTRAYGGAFADYARNELGFKTEMTYSLLDGDISRRWEWGGGRGGGSRFQASATDDIRQLLASNSAFHLLIAHGYSDLVTPYSVSRYVVDHLPPSLMRRPRRAKALSRRAYVLYESRSAGRLHGGCEGLLRLTPGRSVKQSKAWRDQIRLPCFGSLFSACHDRKTALHFCATCFWGLADAYHRRMPLRRDPLSGGDRCGADLDLPLHRLPAIDGLRLSHHRTGAAGKFHTPIRRAERLCKIWRQRRSQPKQFFCPNCGSPLYRTDGEGGAIGIRVGSIDQRRELTPRKQIWCRSALPGVENIEPLPRFEGED